ncbi:ABC transporter substrate-binding protein [Azospirillum sp. ST 5-10]|uniref:ABC transporter substrate-binding protein n=1 Tax=unclassified Azospirillum TaxID=2630922 RepID=UPI003F4A222A
MGHSRKPHAFVLAAAVAAAAALATVPARAEVGEVAISQQFGVSYLPLMVMKNQKLLEKAAAKAGLGDITVNWVQLGGGAATNEALLSGNAHFVAGGVGPLITIWDKTKGSRLEIKGVASLNAMPLYLNTINPAIKSVKDFTDSDKIALPAVKVSIQAVTLQMAAEQAFGEGGENKLDRLTVSMKHPDGMTAMMSGKSEITAHFTSAPFMYQELDDKRVHKVISSYDVLGGPSTFNAVWATAKFRETNPKTYKAFLTALQDSVDLINKDRAKAAAIYVEEENSKLPVAFVEKILADPENEFTLQPKNVMKYVNFMYKIGSIRNKAADWSELFFDDIHGLSGS